MADPVDRTIDLSHDIFVARQMAVGLQNVLDSFRALRQRVSNLRMIFAGSVGLHHMLKNLRQSKLAAEPVNN